MRDFPRSRDTMADMLERDESRDQGRDEGAARVVVAAVIERDGLILAARRTEPPALAGRWEFPGGKVEAGEDDAQALERECREEIGVGIAVGERVGPQYAIAGGAMVVRTYRAVIADGAEPRALDSHDALTWVRPGGPEARDLPWLDGDLLILAALNGGDLSAGVHQVA
jgi:8-oxo-dGTP diphosphatase